MSDINLTVAPDEMDLLLNGLECSKALIIKQATALQQKLVDQANAQITAEAQAPESPSLG